MTGNDRMARAQDYVLGLMDEHERDRAERDLAVDAEFRDCVMQLAERMRRINRERPPAFAQDAWAEVSERIAGMPHLGPRAAETAQAQKPILRLVPGAGSAVGRGLHSAGNRRGVVIAAALAAAFLLGYLAGRFEVLLP